MYMQHQLYSLHSFHIVIPAAYHTFLLEMFTALQIAIMMM